MKALEDHKQPTTQTQGPPTPLTMSRHPQRLDLWLKSIMKKHDPLTHPALDIPLFYSPQLAGAPDAVYHAGSKTQCFAYILKAMQFAVLGAPFL